MYSMYLCIHVYVHMYVHMLKLKLQYFGHLMRRVDSLEKTLMLGGIGGAGGEGDNRGWDGWMASLTRWTWVWVNSRSWWWTGRPDVFRFMGSQRVGHDWATDLIWSDLIVTFCSDFRAQEYKVSHCFHCFPIYFPWGDGTGCLYLPFLNAGF